MRRGRREETWPVAKGTLDSWNYFLEQPSLLFEWRDNARIIFTYVHVNTFSSGRTAACLADGA